MVDRVSRYRHLALTSTPGQGSTRGPAGATWQGAMGTMSALGWVAFLPARMDLPQGIWLGKRRLCLSRRWRKLLPALAGTGVPTVGVFDPLIPLPVASGLEQPLWRKFPDDWTVGGTVGAGRQEPERLGCSHHTATCSSVTKPVLPPLHSPPPPQVPAPASNPLSHFWVPRKLALNRLQWQSWSHPLWFLSPSVCAWMCVCT